MFVYTIEAIPRQSVVHNNSYSGTVSSVPDSRTPMVLGSIPVVKSLVTSSVLHKYVKESATDDAFYEQIHLLSK